MNEAVLKERDDREKALNDKQDKAEKAKNKKLYEESLKIYLKVIKQFGPHIFYESKTLKSSLQNSTRKRAPPGPPTTPRSPSRPTYRTPKALKSCIKQPKMIITLYIRVSSQELQRGLQARQGAAAEQQRSHVLAESGRGMRVRKPSRR